MSDKKISDLVELPTLAADDVLPVVDASANATKRITGANLSNFPTQPTFGGNDVYHQGNVVGAVSQSGGTPTGAVVERDSNANGEYVKFADGTLICTFRSSTELTTSNLQVEVYFSSEPTFTFPEPFVSTPFVSSATLEGNSIVWGMVTNNTSSTSVQMRLLGSRNAARGFLGYIAIGRWY